MTGRFTQKFDRRRLIQGAAAGAALATAPKLAAAAPGVSAPAVIKRGQDAQKVRALMWSNSATIDDHFKSRMDAFNQAHSGTVEVDLQLLPYDEYWQKIQLAYSAGEPYDVYFWDIQAYGHYKNDLLLNVQPYIDTAGLYSPDEYPTKLFDVWRFDGTNLYAMPENIQTVALFYNKALLDEAGVAYPDDTWTWDQVIEAGTTTTKKDGRRVSQYGLSLGVMSTWWGLQPLSWAKGTAFVDQIVEPTKFQFSDPLNVETLKWAQDLIQTQGIVPNPTNAAQAGDTESFQSGRIAMSVQGSWDISGFAELPFEWGMTSLPLLNGNRVVPYFMGGWVIAKDSKVPDGAFEWARWSASDYQPTMSAEHDWIPIRTADRNADTTYEGLPDGLREVTAATESAQIGDFYTTNSQEIWNTVFTPNFDQLFNGTQSPEDTAKNLDEQSNALLTS
jgi:multiple sugar transport system substrate-binding protein